jgi:tryptophan-rich sensory protein
MNYKNLVKFFTSIIICETAGIIGSFFTISAINSWYRGLEKPFFNPPNWIFGPVWTILYILIGISLFLVWTKNWEPKNAIEKIESKKINKFSKKFYTGEWKKANIILIFYIQLFLNILWSQVFFGAQLIGGGFFVLLMLWVSIVFMIINFYRVYKATFWLLLPYIVWVSFAGILNFSIWILN